MPPSAMHDPTRKCLLRVEIEQRIPEYTIQIGDKSSDGSSRLWAKI